MLPGYFATLANLFCGASNPLALLLDSSSSRSDNSEESQDIDADASAFDKFINPYRQNESWGVIQCCSSEVVEESVKMMTFKSGHDWDGNALD